MSTPPALPSVSLPLALVADVQDAQLMAMTGLKRLESLLDQAVGNLLEHLAQLIVHTGQEPPWVT